MPWLGSAPFQRHHSRSQRDGNGCVVKAPVAAHPFTVKTLKQGKAGVSARRAAVRTALMLARPEQR